MNEIYTIFIISEKMEKETNKQILAKLETLTSGSDKVQTGLQELKDGQTRMTAELSSVRKEVETVKGEVTRLKERNDDIEGRLSQLEERNEGPGRRDYQWREAVDYAKRVVVFDTTRK